MLERLGALVFGLGLVTFVAPASAQMPAPQGPPVIVTTGEGVVKAAPDRAWVTIAAEARDRNAQAAQTANTQAMTAVIAQIKAAGVPADAIQTSGYTLQPEFDYANGRQSLRDYLARNQVQVRVDALPKLGEILTAAVATGATNVSGVRFDLKDRESVERRALTEAVRDARARADAIASGAGVQIDRILRIEEERQSVVGPLRYNMADQVRVAGAVPQPVPIESGEIEVHAQVTLTAAIK
jgi:uncharacterized protein YggE